MIKLYQLSNKIKENKKITYTANKWLSSITYGFVNILRQKKPCLTQLEYQIIMSAMPLRYTAHRMN